VRTHRVRPTGQRRSDRTGASAWRDPLPILQARHPKRRRESGHHHARTRRRKHERNAKARCGCSCGCRHHVWRLLRAQGVRVGIPYRRGMAGRGVESLP
jgi:hypothetical protein